MSGGLPSFVVAGARKAGTTWLDVCLRGHPQLYLPTATKEICFFDRHYERGPDWYARYFAGAPERAVLGEITSSYLAHEEAPARLAQVLPDATVVALLRNPVDRAWSDYGHYWSKGDMAGSVGFEEACRQLPSILEEGFYRRQIARWLQHVPRERLAVFVIEDARENPEAFLSSIFARLGVDPSVVPEAARTRVNEARRPRSRLVAAAAHRVSRTLHASGLHTVVRAAKRLRLDQLVMARSRGPSPTGRALTDTDRAKLAALYRPDVEALSDLIQLDLAHRWFGA